MIVIDNGVVVTPTDQFEGYVAIQGEFIVHIGSGSCPAFVKTDDGQLLDFAGATKIDARRGYIMAGAIDDQVHFREPGLTHKGEIATESRAAIAGGVTSFMEMPNTNPQTVDRDSLAQKFDRAAQCSPANFSFYLGATNDNVKAVEAVDARHTAGVKIFMGSSTGNMLVDNRRSLEAIFESCPTLIATHCEDESIIKANFARFGSSAKITDHPDIRSAEACYRSSALAVELATKYNSRLHILHLSTERELSLFESKKTIDKRITNEVCVHHLWFSRPDYASSGNRIKWNPAIKETTDRDALRAGLLTNRVDVVATDHAPHTWEEKQRPYLDAPSGGPMVEHSVSAMMSLFSPCQVTEYMSHRVADCFAIDRRGYLRQGYYADVIVVAKERFMVADADVHYKCGWSPLDGVELSHRVKLTIVNGVVVYQDGQLIEGVPMGKPLIFNR